MRNQTSFRLTTTVLPTDVGAQHTAKTTNVINKVDSSGNPFKPTFTEETLVLTNDDRTVMETVRATADNGVLTFVKRGLSDDNTETEVANRKLTWNPGTLVFITAGASDRIDIDDDITWTGKQTYTDDMTSCGKATYNGVLESKKGVKYPNFANTTCLNAYENPFGGMFATVDDTGELYRYNAFTCCWDMVSTVALGTYQITCSATAPAPGTAETIVTLSPEQSKVYLGEKIVVGENLYADVLVVGGGGGGGGFVGNGGGGGGGAGGAILCNSYPLTSHSVCIRVGAGGTGGVSEACNITSGCNGNPSTFDKLTVLGGGGGGTGTSGGCPGANGGGGGSTGCYDGIGGAGYSNGFSDGHSGGSGRHGNASGQAACVGRGGGGGGASEEGCTSPDTAGGEGVSLNIGGCCIMVSYGGGGAGRCDGGYTSNYCGSGGAGGGGTYGTGKCGVVIVAYPTDGSYGYSCATGGTTACCTMGDKTYCVHTFTSDGTFCIVS